MTNREDEILANIGPTSAADITQTIDFARDSLLVSTQGGGAAESTDATINGSDNNTVASGAVETPNANGIAQINNSPTSSTTFTTNNTTPNTSTTSTSSTNDTNNSPNHSLLTNNTTITTATSNNLTTTNTETNQNEHVPIPNSTTEGASELWASENPPSSASSGFSDDDSLAGTDVGDPKTIEQIVEMVKERGRQGLIKEYAEIRARAPEGTFTQAR